MGSWARWTFRERLTLLVLVLLGVALVVLGYVLAGSAKSLIEDRTRVLLEARTEQLATDLEGWHRSNLSRAIQLASAPAVVLWCRSTPEERASKASTVRAILQALETAADGEIAGRVLDASGHIAIAGDPVHEGKDVSFRSYVRQAMRGEPVISDLYSAGATTDDAPRVLYAAPVIGTTGEIACVAVISIQALEILERIKAASGRAGEGSSFEVVDRYGIRIGGGREQDLYRPIASIDPDSAARLVRDRRFGDQTEATIAAVQPLATTGRFWTKRSLDSTLWTVVGSVPEDVVAPAYRRLFVEALLLAGAFLALAFLAVRAAAKTLLEPLRPVAGAIASMSKGDLKARVGAPGDDEVGALGARFNEMAESIESSRRLLEARVRERTLEIERLTEQLDSMHGKHRTLDADRGTYERRVRGLEAASRERAEFLTGLSSQLGASLSSLISLSDILLSESRDRLLPEQIQAADEVLSSGRHLLGVSKALLELFRIEAGHVTVNLVPMSPAAAIRAASGLVRPWALKRGIVVEEQIDAHLPVLADAAKLRQILLSLLTNAVKFSPDGSRVRVTAEEWAAEVRFSVTDQGPGIEPQRLARLFEPFAAGGLPQPGARTPGSGLGLAIARRLVERQGGVIGVESGPGGSTFFFTAPIAPGPGVVPLFLRAPIEPERLVRTVGRLTRKSQPGEPPAVLAYGRDAGALARLREMLAPADARLMITERAADTVEIALREKPAMVLVELTGAEEPTFDLLEALAADARSEPRPILVLEPDGLDDAQCLALEQRIRAIVGRGNVARGVLAATIQKITQEIPAISVKDEAIKGPAVLVVDDDPERRDQARSFLERKGFRVLVATDGEAGLALARKERPALILMDLAMPEKHGYAAARELKADSATAPIPIVALTAVPLADDEQRAAGFDGFLAKPLDLAALEGLVAQLVVAP